MSQEIQFNQAVQKSSAPMDIATTRAAQEVQAAMVIAKKFPRDQNACVEKIVQSCRRESLAKNASYEYPKGKDPVTGKPNVVSGPSIRLAEVLAQNWGNMDFGVVELDQNKTESSIMAYAWDLETNTRQTKIFTVAHKRHTRNGDYPVTDPREIYEMVANSGARRLRACILGVIPGDVCEVAENECDKTLTNGKDPLPQRISKMVEAFAVQNVTAQMLTNRLGHSIDSMTAKEVLGLGKLYNALKDGFVKIEELFPTKPEGPKFGADAQSDESAESEAGLAPEQDSTASDAPTASAPTVQSSTPPLTAQVSAAAAAASPAKAPLRTIHQIFQQGLDKHGITLDEFNRWGVETSNLRQEAASVEEIDGRTLRKLEAALPSIAAMIKQARNPMKVEQTRGGSALEGEGRLL